MKIDLLVSTLAAASMIRASAAAPVAPRNDRPIAGWRMLAPLPDPVGFGGMFAGALGGRLIVGGGSQFRGRPFWLKGEKSYSDRIYALAAPTAAWGRLELRLPQAIGHFAQATGADAIYLVGGVTAAGCRSTAWKLCLRDDAVAIDALPDLPHPLCQAAAAVVDRRLFVAGGQFNPLERSASAEFWSLDLGPRSAGWRQEADLPGPGVAAPMAATDGHALYLFGGVAYDADGKQIPSRQALRYDVARRAWERLPDMPEPRVGAATPCPRLPAGKFMLIGGYAVVYTGDPRVNPGFTSQTLYFDPVDRRWSKGPVLPRALVGDRDLTTDAGPNPMVGAPCALWRGLAVVVAGETRSSTRTPAVIAWSWDPVTDR